MRSSGKKALVAMLLTILALTALVSISPVQFAPNVYASSSVSITTSNGSTVCSSTGSLASLVSGSLSWSSSTCTVSGLLSISSGTILDVGAGVTVTSSNSGLALPSDGIDNSGTINNYGTMTGTSFNSGEGLGIYNLDTINNMGTVTGIGDLAGIYNLGTIYNVGTVAGGGGSIGDINNGGTINDYCGVTLSFSTYSGTSPNPISCYTVTFDQSGIPTSGATWGVTANWGPFTLSVDHTGSGGSLTMQAVGSLSYTYDTPVTYSGTTYDCSSGCTGITTISGTTTISPIASFTIPVYNAGPPKIPPGTTPSILNLTAYDGSPIHAYYVGMIGTGAVIYNMPSVNQTQLNNDLKHGDFSLLPVSVSFCSEQLGGETLIRVSGFSQMWWGGSINSTEFVFGYYESFLTSSQGWPSEPACTS